MWLILSLFSSFFLGMYDIAKKNAVTGNAVFPVLFFSTLSGSMCLAPIVLLSHVNPSFAEHWHVYVQPQTMSAHLLMIAKSCIVGTSWVLSYFGLKHLPITIASPIRASAPIFTVLGAVVLFGERPSLVQTVGILLVLISYFVYSRSNRKDTKSKPKVVWIIFMILAALTGAISAGFDKYLLQIKSLPPLFVLFWFLFYLSIIYGVITLVLWYPQRKKSTPLVIRPGIPLVGILLVVSDILYMVALSNPLAQLSLVSSIRRSNVLISFAGGILVFHEGNIRKKLIPFCGIISGLICIMM